MRRSTLHALVSSLALGALGLLLLGAGTADAHPHRRLGRPGGHTGPGTNWNHPARPRGALAAARPGRGFRSNPPGPAGGPGTNWANPPGPAGGPGASPFRLRPYRYRAPRW